jgi:hypothetical protein
MKETLPSTFKTNSQPKQIHSERQRVEIYSNDPKFLQNLEDVIAILDQRKPASTQDSVVAELIKFREEIIILLESNQELDYSQYSRVAAIVRQMEEIFRSAEPNAPTLNTANRELGTVLSNLREAMLRSNIVNDLEGVVNKLADHNQNEVGISNPINGVLENLIQSITSLISSDASSTVLKIFLQRLNHALKLDSQATRKISLEELEMQEILSISQRMDLIAEANPAITPEDIQANNFDRKQTGEDKRVIWRNQFYHTIERSPDFAHTPIDNISTADKIELICQLLPQDNLETILRFKVLATQYRFVNAKPEKELDRIERINKLRDTADSGNKADYKSWLDHYKNNVIPNLQTGLGDHKLILTEQEKFILEVKAKLIELFL